MKKDFKLDDSKSIAEAKVTGAGRPTVAPEDKADKKIVLYVTGKEKQTLQTKAEEAGVKLPIYLRSRLGLI